MNEKYIKARMADIRFSLGERKIRVKQAIGISAHQVELTKRILKIREIIEGLPDNKSIMVWGDDAHIHYLFRFTRLAEKNITGFIDDIQNKCIYNAFKDYKEYPIFSLGEVDWKKVECVLVAGLIPKDTLQNTLAENQYQGDICYLYDEKDTIPFFCIPETVSYHNESMLNNPAKAILTNICKAPMEYYFGMIERIDKINRILDTCGNKRILVYGVGGHTGCLFEYTNIKYKNVVAFADRSARIFYGMTVRDTAVESFRDIDFIVISSFRYQEEIEKFLISIGMQDKIVKLYDSTDETTFYEMPNVCAPDRPASYGRSKNGFSMADIYAAAEWSSERLSRDSEYLVTYNLLKNQIIDEGILHNRGEHEVLVEKNYAAANRQVAIVLQGPIEYDDGFTFRTVCYYRILFPESQIILSTWESETSNPEFKHFRELPIEIVLSEPPKEKGVLNINYQLKSTYAGILQAKKMGYQYVLKTRTDFRLYADDCLSYLCAMTKAFPSKGSANKRIGILQPFLDVAYYIPDYILFGDTEDMLNFWGMDEVGPDQATADMNPEMLLFTRYIKSLNCYVEDPLNHLKEYMDMLCREFIIVDPSIYKYYWKKYSYEGSVLYRESKNRLTTADWFVRQYK